MNDNDELRPISRIEQYLHACCEGCGCADLPQPQTRIDDLLYQLAEKLAENGV